MSSFNMFEECTICKCSTCEYRGNECTCNKCTGVKESPDDLNAFFVSMYSRCKIKEELDSGKA